MKYSTSRRKIKINTTHVSSTVSSIFHIQFPITIFKHISHIESDASADPSPETV